MEREMEISNKLPISKYIVVYTCIDATWRNCIEVWHLDLRDQAGH